MNRSSLTYDVEKTTYGAFVDVDPASETISLRSLVRLLRCYISSGDGLLFVLIE